MELESNGLMSSEEYRQAVIVSVVLLAIGLVLVYFSKSVYVPSTQSLFLGIPYATTEDNASNVYTKISTLLLGFLISGIGLGCAISIYPFYDLERHKLTKLQQPKKTDAA